MERIVKSFLLCVMFICCVPVLGGITFFSNGISYESLSSTGSKTCKVVRQQESLKGDIKIPSSVYNNGSSYKVVMIDDYAFGGTKITSIFIPSSINTIGRCPFMCSTLTSLEVDEKNSTFDSRNSCNAVIHTSTNTLVAACPVSVIPSGVKEIGDYAFNAFKNSSITIPNTVTKIGNNAFYWSKLTSVEIPSSVKIIGNDAFNYPTTSSVSPLKSVIFHNGLEEIGENAFSNTSLTSVTIPSSVIRMKRSFNLCKSLLNVTFENGVQLVDSSAFANCINLTTVSIPTSVKRIASSAFYCCGNLTTCDISGDVESYAFNSCSKLSTVSLNNSFSIGDNAFCNTAIKKIELPNTMVTISSHAFYNCKELSVISMSNNMKFIGWGAFEGCNSLEKVIIPDVGAWCTVEFETYTEDYNITNPLYGKYIYKDNNSIIEDLVIPEGVDSISNAVFDGCLGIKTITLPNTLKSIGKYAFYGCAKGSILTIPENVTEIQSGAFSGPTTFYLNANAKYLYTYMGSFPFDSYSLKYYLGNSITEIVLGENVSSLQGFYYLPNLEKISILGVIEDINISKCDNLSIINIPKGTKSVSIINCPKISSLIIPDGVNIINFGGCKGLNEINIPSSVEFLGQEAFEGCISLTSLVLPNGIKNLPNSAFSGCTNLSSVSLPHYLLSIGASAFYGCVNLNTINISDSLTTIGGYAFSGSNIGSIYIPNSVQSIGNNAFSNCPNLKSVILDNQKVVSENRTNTTALSTIFGTQVNVYTLGEHVSTLGNYAFYGCTEMANIQFPQTLIAIGNFALGNCKGISNISLPDSIERIGNNAFSGCSNLKEINLPDNIKSLTRDTFKGCAAKLFANKGSSTLLALWNSNYIPLETGTENVLSAPKITLTNKTQTTFTLHIAPFYQEYEHFYTDYYQQWGTKKVFKEDSLLISCLTPNQSYNVDVSLGKNDMYYHITDNVTTSSLNPSIKTVASTASSLSIACGYTEGDALVTNEEMRVNGKTIVGVEASFTGLDPDKSYSVEYIISGTHDNGQTWSCTERRTINTKSLSLKTRQPKVVSEGNVIVAAQSNVDDEETNVGFEWRRTDWSDEFPSNTGTACLYEGTIEGFIRNLNTNFLFKFRPYYLSDSGTYYYGDWMGLDPTNTSYFEPTVHTYGSITVEGNTALVKGYALRGTENVVVQGFKYWKEKTNANSGRLLMPSIPSDAKTVEATGQVMRANLTDLDYNSTYSYVAFVTTSEGQTYYGEQQTFTTGENLTGINETIWSDNDADPVTVVARYNIRGIRINTPERGVNILRMSDGTTRKVYVK